MIVRELFEAKPPTKQRTTSFIKTGLFEETWSVVKTADRAKRLAEFVIAKSERPPLRLPNGFKDHSLSPGPLAGYNEVHLDVDVLLIYSDSKDVVTLFKVISHKDLEGHRKTALAKQLNKL